MRYFSFDQTIGESKIYGFGKSSSSGEPVTPDKPALSDYILAGNATEAVSYAVEQLAGSAVSWMLDKPNSRVSYDDPNASVGITTVPYAWCINNFGDNPKADEMIRFGGVTAESACEIASKLYGYGDGSYVRDVTETIAECFKSDGSTSRLLFLYKNAAYDPNAPVVDSKIHITIADIVTKIRASAASGHAPSQAAVNVTT